MRSSECQALGEIEGGCTGIFREVRRRSLSGLGIRPPLSSAHRLKSDFVPHRLVPVGRQPAASTLPFSPERRG